MHIHTHHTHVHTQHTHAHTSSSSSSSDLLAPKGIGQDPGSSLGPVTKADRVSNGWGEWLPGTLAVKMAVRARQIDRTVSRSRDGGTVQLPDQETPGGVVKGWC